MNSSIRTAITIPQSCRLALTALALLAPCLFAGEIVLFDGGDFQGDSMVFRDSAPDLDPTGFNDRAASISVRDGTWEVCFDANFQGSCMQLQPGDYPRLDPPFHNSISSLRQIASTEYGGNYPAPPATNSAAPNEITLFDRENFEGNRITYGDSVSSLDGTGFNDRTASISVRGGTWEVCFDANFQGSCMQLQPGDYPRLDPPFNRSISSVRPLGGLYYGGNYPAPPPQENFGIGLPDVGVEINLSSYPDLVPVPGYPVYYAPQVNSNYFFYDGMYWVYQQDHWYASSWYNGPWGFVAPEAVPLFVLRIPVGYYRRPPAYFRGWSSEAPPRWGEHWGNAWAQSHRGWDNWNRNAAPAPAPLPAYQRQYSGDRYPVAAQQRSLQSQNYRYQPRDPVVRQHYQTQQAIAPAPRAQPPQPAGREVQRPGASPPSQQGATPVPRAQPPRSASREVERPAAPAPSPQGGPTARPQAQQAQQGAALRQQEARKAQPQAQETRRVQPQAQQPQQGMAQRHEQGRKAQGEGKEPQGKGPAKEPKQGQVQRGGAGQQPGEERSR